MTIVTDMSLQGVAGSGAAQSRVITSVRPVLTLRDCFVEGFSQ